MILFKTLRWKNFLSTGNNWSELDFLNDKTTLVVGHNGAGKSTMLDALAYALFGKAHRNIKNAQLVNSINKKGTLVEVTFNVAGSDFKIIRGQKPAIFEIWKGDVMLNQDSHAKEYQKILEQNILKLNHKSFHQIVVLGSSSFIPFMQLSANYRKDVIEDLLDIGVFSKMNGLLKEKTSTLRENIKDITHKIEILSTKMDSQKKYIKDIENLNNQQKNEKANLINQHREEIKTLQEENKNFGDSVIELEQPANDRHNQINQEIVDSQQRQANINAEIKRLVKDTKFFESNDTCPSCSQPISEEMRRDRVDNAKGTARVLSDSLESIVSKLKQDQETLTSCQEQLDRIREWQNQIYSNNQSIDNFQKAIDRIQKEMEDSKGDVDAEITALTEMQTEHSNDVESKLKLNEQFQYNQVIATMLKDTGIKTKIIKQYLPVINKLCNQFLQILDFYVHFELDEAFVETIRSRHRDQFTYDSFSEGEKQRIDLALLFTWRHIAKMKNSASTNLLVLDETFDSSLDVDGVDNLTKILGTMDEDTNVFIISHKGDVLQDKFRSRIEFFKKNNFSKIR